MTTWSRWLTRRARASGVLILTQLVLVVVTTALVAGAMGWSDATATTAARSALAAGSDSEATVVQVRMRRGDDPRAQDHLARERLAQGFAPAPVSIFTREEPDPRGGTGFVVWVVAPDVGSILPGHLGALADGAAEATRVAVAADLTGRGVTVEGDLAPIARAAAARWASARALAWVPLGVLFVITVIAVAQVAALLAAAREREVHLLLARGARPAQLLWAEAAESTAVTGAGTLVGLLAALAVVRVVSGAVNDVTPIIAGALGTGALIVITLAISTELQIRRTTNPATRPDRVPAIAGAASALAVATGAAVSLWQLNSTGSVVVAGPDGERSPDLVAAMAPALLLLAAAVLGMVLLGPLTRLVERLAHSVGSAAFPLAASQLSRQLAHQAVSVVLTILAVGTITLASLFAGSASELEQDHRTLLAATDVRASISPPPKAPVAPRSVPQIVGHGGVTASVPVWLDETAGIGDMTLKAVAAPLAALAQVATLPQDYAVPSLSPEAPTVGAPGPIEVPARTSTLRLELKATVSFDEWQSEAIRLGYEYGEAQALAEAEGQEPSEDELRVMAVQFASHLWDAAAAPLELEPALLVRDLESGQAELVRGDTLTLQPGLEVDEADLRNPKPVADSGTAVLEVPLDPTRRIAVDAVHVTLADGGDPGSRTLGFNIGLSVDSGDPLDADAGWSSNYAVPADLARPYEDQRSAALPASVTVDTWDFHGFARVDLKSNKPDLPAVLEVTDTGFAWRGDTLGTEQLRLAAGQPLLGRDPLAVTAEREVPVPTPVPVGLTRAAADAAQLDVGDTFQLQVLERAVPAVLQQLVEVVPGVDSPRAAILDSSLLAAHRSLSSGTLPWPQEVWASAPDPVAAARALEKLDGVEHVSFTDDAPDGSAATDTATTFWVAAGGAVLLMLVGVGGAASTALEHRRPEVAVLRALGMGTDAQALSRSLEVALALWPAALFGMVGGWLVGRLVVVELASSAVPEAGALVPSLELSWTPLALLLTAVVIGLGLVNFAVGALVARQARDKTYREEVR
ncbi:ABC transporter permease [Tessaracoccus sp. OS52]|uniref:ABC transporter permease n=1 Tax=Tessaracoccus sp. OS52 TaxID=2886691 RepID=UPI001D0F7FBD|nr:ABC transporter permease [Tessaracoccus sp. OS52]MCC2592785.1 ABC transporter permease [Tessaracoccus sp. OS52]